MDSARANRIPRYGELPVRAPPSAVGKALTGTATNGYRFWSIPDQPPAGQAARQQAAQVAAEKTA